MIYLSNTPDKNLENLCDDSKNKYHYPFWNENMREYYDKIKLIENENLIYTKKLNNNHKNWFFNKFHYIGDNEIENINFVHPFEDSQNDTFLRNKNIKININSQAKKQLTEWSHLYRYAYNRAVWFFNETGLTGMKLRDCVKSESQWVFHDFVKKLPSALKEGAAKEVMSAVSAAFSNLKAGNIHNFSMKYRSKRSQKKWTIKNFPQASYKKISDKYFMIYNTIFPHLILAHEKLPDKMDHDFSIHFNGINHYLCIPYTIQKRNRNIGGNVISLDPGIRSFQTAFDYHNNKVTEICTGQSVGHLHSIAIQIDRMIGAREKGCYRSNPGNNRRKRKFRSMITKRIKKTRMKLKNLQRELHNQTANYLTKRLPQTILLPHFETQSMSKKVKRKLNKKSVRNLSLLAHHAFKLKLKSKAEERGVYVLDCTEHFTSRTCGRCGLLNTKTGCKQFHCSRCNLIIDRDVNAARNILLRAMRDSAVYKNTNET